MITVDVPRAVAWTRVRAGEEIALNLSVSVVSAPKVKGADTTDSTFSETELGSCQISEVCDGGPRVWR